MKQLLIIVILLQQIVYAQPGDAAKERAIRVMNEIKDNIKRFALIQNTFDYAAFDNEIAALNANQYHEDSLMIPYITTLLKHLRLNGDKHSFYIGPKSMASIAASETILKMPAVVLLENSIGLIKVPGFLSFNKDDIKRFADTLRKQIKTIDQDNTIKGWIVDLTQNTGGNMWPMLAGLNPLIEDGIVGYFIDLKGRATSAWKSESSKPDFVGNLDVNYKCKNLQTKIAVLIDSTTGSSGEMTAISFEGLKNARFFGKASAGFTTANQTIPLSNGGMLLLATKYSADRNKTVYKGKIIPDVITDNSEILETTIKWLLEK